MNSHALSPAQQQNCSLLKNPKPYENSTEPIEFLQAIENQFILA
jgi:hypothetical protein